MAFRATKTMLPSPHDKEKSNKPTKNRQYPQNDAPSALAEARPNRITKAALFDAAQSLSHYQYPTGDYLRHAQDHSDTPFEKEEEASREDSEHILIKIHWRRKRQLPESILINTQFEST